MPQRYAARSRHTSAFHDRRGNSGARGTAWAGAAYHRFDGLLFGLAIGVMLLAHAAANVYNDVGDDITGADPGNVEHIYPYTGGSRFIQADFYRALR